MKTQTHPRLSVVIVSWNRREDLAVAIKSVRAQTHDSYELIVVDNGSTDGTIDLLENGALGPLVLYKAGTNLGASVARNIGLKLARGKYVAFMDSDAELLDADALAQLEARLESDPKLGAIGLAIYLDRDKQEVWRMGNYHLRGGYSDIDRAKAEWRDPDYMNTCFSLWRREAVAQLGGFDPAFPYGFEDDDLSLRFRRAGYRLEIDPSRAAVHHLSKASRIRAESDGYEHFAYDYRSRILMQLKDRGFWGFLKEEAWQWSSAGRRQRYFIYLHSGLRRRQRIRLYALEPIKALLAHPRHVFTRGRADYIAQAPLDEKRLVRI